MRFPSAHTSTLLVIGALAFPMLGGQGLFALANDPHRWARADIYICLATATYALVWLAAFCSSRRFRQHVATQSWWESVYLNPVILVLASLHWAAHHDPVFLIVIPGLIAWMAWRQGRSSKATG